ncbi:MAG: aminoacyltransferase [Brachybacterium sp.]|uniref:lipid II:glycine glycyltransferase FemX n=1 Tax=Brachybacterium sp. TaxID=1891286 RepID=UPI0026498443|nr:peptidoglycan bridge formation glycyltransferase FemA/FemB family protein [Brachybacterium sp.]MDN5686079.1 aminoacyltransferase [Brachybacterium sp.]
MRPISAEQFREFLDRSPEANYQQTPAWGEVRRGQWQPELLGWFDDEECCVGVAVVRYRAVPGIGLRFAYIPHGPVLDWGRADVAGVLAGLRRHLVSRRVFGVRMSPPLSTRVWAAERVRRGRTDPNLRHLTEMEPDAVDPVAEQAERMLRAEGWRRLEDEESVDGVHPRYTHRLPIAGQTEEELLAAMSQTWRRHLRRSAREGGEVRRATDRDLETIHDLHVDTARRQGFPAHSREMFDAIWEHFGAERSARFHVDLGCHEEEALSAYTVIQVGGTAHMVFGSNSLRLPQLHLSNAVIWEQIRQAISNGAHVYDLGVVTPALDDDHPQVGLLRFKTGLGGEVVEGIGSWELAIRPAVYYAFTNLYPRYSAASSALRNRIRVRVIDRLGAAGRSPAGAAPAKSSRMRRV